MRDAAAVVIPPFTEQDLLPFLIHHYLESGNAISLWTMPHSAEKHLLICSDGVRHLDDLNLEESETGFVFAPYDGHQKKVFFRSDLIYTFKNGLLDSENLPEAIVNKVRANKTVDSDLSTTYPVLPFANNPIPENYKALVEKSIAFIRTGAIEKVVPSRSKTIALPEGFDLWKTFNKLCNAYPNCMISLVSSEETGTWMGATPELLVCINEQKHFRTVALAGTKRYEPGMDIKSIAWTEKEIEEQAMVCRYVISCFKKIRLREYEEHGPRTVVAGNLVHLKTEYDVDMVATNFPQLGSTMLRLLHPTSAVCGMPLEPAQEFLRANEGYDRQFYSGFLGPVNFRNGSDLFVNLRCMQLGNKTAILYAGAGVTIDSNPEKEWEETEMKFDTLLSKVK
jgi:isochorismate synthase